MFSDNAIRAVIIRYWLFGFVNRWSRVQILQPAPKNQWLSSSADCWTGRIVHELSTECSDHRSHCSLLVLLPLASLAAARQARAAADRGGECV